MPSRRMTRPLLRWLLTIVLLVVSRPMAAAGDSGLAAGPAAPLPPEQVFALDAARATDGSIDLVFGIRDGYYLYRERIHATPEPAAGMPPMLELPPGKVKDDPNFGRVEIYRGEVTGRVGGGPDGSWTLAVRYQGCADAGLCYPPETEEWPVDFTGMTPARFQIEAAPVTRLTILQRRQVPDLPRLALLS